MSEHEPSPEHPEYSREQILGMYKQFIDQGFTNPEDLPPGDPAVAEVTRRLDAWAERAERQAQQNPAPDAMVDYSVSRTTALVDAGFSDPDYLEEVANDWLMGDLEDAQRQGLTEAAARIQAKIDEINARLEA